MPYDASKLPALAAILGRDAPAQAEPKRDDLSDIVASSAVSAYGNLRYGLPAAVERVAGTLTPEDEKYYTAWNRQKAEQARTIAPTGAASFQDLPGIGSGKVGFGRFLAENVAAMVPQLGATVVGGLAGGVPGAVAANTPLFAGANASRALEETGGITQDQALMGLAASPAQAAMDVFAERFLPGAGKLFGPLGAKALGGGIIKRTAKGALQGSVAEAVTETGQQALERASVGLPMTNQDAARELVTAFGTAFFVGGALGGVGGMFRKVASQPGGQATNEDLNAATDEALALPVTTQTGPVGKNFSGTNLAEASEFGLGFNKVKPSATPPVSPWAVNLFEEPYELGQMNLPPGKGFQLGANASGTPTVDTQAPPLALPAPDPTTTAFTTPGGKSVLGNEQQAALQAALEQQPSGDLLAVLERSKDPQVTEAVERELATRRGVGEGSNRVAVPASVTTEPEPFSFAGVTKGVRLNQGLKGLADADEETFRAGVRTLLAGGDTRAGTFAVAERLGIDVNKPGEAIEAPQRDSLQQLLDQEETTRNAFVGLLDAKSKRALETRVVEALGKQVPEAIAADPAAAQSYSDRLDKLAQQMDLMDRDGLTERARKIAIKEPVSRQELDAVAEAAAAKIPNLDVETFEAGYQGLPVPRRVELSPEQQASYAAGKAWKAPAVATAAETQGVIQDRQASIDDRDPTAANWTKAPNQDIQQDIAVQIEALKAPREVSRVPGTVEMAPAAPDTEIAAIQQMVAEGRPESEVRQALAVVQQGGTLFAQPAPAPLDIIGETVTRGAPNARSIERAQLKARDEINAAHDVGTITTADRDAQLAQLTVGNIAAEDLGLGRQARREEVAAAKRAREETKTNKKAEALRAQIREEYKDTGDRARFMRLTKALDERDFAAVTGRLNIKTNASRSTELFDMTEAVALELQLEGKSFHGLVNFLQANTRNALDREVVTSIKTMTNKLLRAGMKFEFKVAHEGDVVPGMLQTSRALMEVKEGVATVWVNGVDVRGKTGWNYSTLLHEVAHSATVMAMQYGQENPNTPIGVAVKDLQTVLAEVRLHTQALGKGNRYNLTPFELEMYERDNNALDDTDELLAWTLSDSRMQEYLAGIPFTPTQTMWGRLVQAVAKLFGLAEGRGTALEAVLRASERLLDATDGEVSNLSRGWTVTRSMQDGIPRSVSETSKALKVAIPQYSEAIDKFAEKTNMRDVSSKARKGWFGVFSKNHLVQQYGRLLPGMAEVTHADDAKHATVSKLAHLFSPVHHAFGALKPEYQEKTQGLMQATEFGATPGMRWEDQTWLHDLPNAAALKQRVAEWNHNYKTLERNGAAHVYNDLKALNQAQLHMEMAIGLHNRVTEDEQLGLEIKSGYQSDPMAAFRASPEYSASPTTSLAYWKAQYAQRAAGAQEYIDTLRGSLGGLPKREIAQAEQRLTPLEAQLKFDNQALTRIARSPYFHLGRHGDQFLSFGAKNVKGVTVPGAAVKIAEAFEKAGLDGVYVSPDSADPRIYMRFDSLVARGKAEEVIKELTARGLIDPEVEVLAGPRDASGPNASGQQAWLSQLIQGLSSDPAFSTEGLDKDEAAEINKHKSQMLSQLKSIHLEMLSDNSLAKVMTPRKGRPGYSADMMRSFAQRYQMSTWGLANMTVAPAYNQAFTQMKDAINKARVVTAANHGDVQTMFDLRGEMMQRQYSDVELERTVFADRFRAGANFFGLAFSPAYVAIQGTQVLTLLLPQLGSKHGFSKSFGEIAKATGPALRIMAEVAKAAYAVGDLNTRSGAAAKADAISDMAITADALKKAGLNTGQTQFLIQMIASGSIDIGSVAREMGRVAEGETDHAFDRVMRWGATAGLYAETTTRLISALSTYELHKDGKSKQSVGDYARQVLKDAMLDYSSDNVGRKLGRQGWLGQLTPIVAQFMQYQAQVTEKIYREVHKAIGGDKEAGKFLVSHAAAVASLAGVLGLPFATVAARAVELMVDMWDDDEEPFDATAAVRGFFSSVFGEDVGEMIARGAPRGLGIDISERVGEQNFVPMSQFWVDRQNWRDAAKDQALRAFGPGTNMSVGVADGMAKIADGDITAGMVAMFPVALKNPIKAGQMVAQGEHRDARGNTLPIETPGAKEILAQAMGFGSAERADYMEKVQDQRERRSSITRQSTVLRNQLVRAALDQDWGGFRETMANAQAWNASNPKFSVDMDDVEKTITRRLKQQAVSKVTGAPLGVAADDLAGQALTRY